MIGFVAPRRAAAEPDSPRAAGARRRSATSPRILAERGGRRGDLRASPRASSTSSRSCSSLCRSAASCARVALDCFPHAQGRASLLEELDGMPLADLHDHPGGPFQLVVKRAARPRALGAAAGRSPLPLDLSPWRWRSSSPRAAPCSSARQRCGLNGRRFTLYKFRTMVDDAEERRLEVAHLNEMDGPVFKAPTTRASPGRPLAAPLQPRRAAAALERAARRHEPGRPAPADPEEVARYERWQRRRLSMKPGHDLPLAGLGPQRARLQPLDGARPRTTSTTGPSGSTSRSCSRTCRGAVGPRRLLRERYSRGARGAAKASTRSRTSSRSSLV